MAEGAKYTIVGRYMDGSSVTAYHLLDNSGEQRKLTREQVILLIGKGDITNCRAQLHNDSVLLRGVGVSLNDLPVVNERTGSLKNTEGLGRLARGATTDQVLAQLLIVGKMVQGNKVVGFTIANAGGATRDVSREQTEILAGQMKIGNARLQEYKGRKILRLLNGRMDDLPVTVNVPL